MVNLFDHFGTDLKRRSVFYALANHKATVSLWVAWYNFVRVNTAIRMTPAMAAGLTGTIWTMRELLSWE